jgi:hypothetical protein
METEAVFVISDDSDQEDSSSARRKADEQDPLAGKRILRNKKTKVSESGFCFDEF